MSTRPLLLPFAPAAPAKPEMRYLFERYFDVEEYRSDQQYDPNNTFVVVPNWDAADWCHHLYDQGFRVIIDNLWELPGTWKGVKEYQSWDTDRIHVMETANWFWYHESLRSVYVKYRPVVEPTYQHLALMLLNKQKTHRTRLYESMQPWLHDCYWSYYEMGHHHVPGDLDMKDWSTQRYVNHDWYNHTCFSMVGETFVDYHSPWDGSTRWIHHCFNQPFEDSDRPFVTEKTFKPIQYQHPFMVYGHSGTLKFLHNLGFETFENLFDESYDSVVASTSIDKKKLEIIINNVKNFEKGPRDQLTQEKIQHNRAQFSNMALVESRFVKEIIEPIMEFVS